MANSKITITEVPGAYARLNAPGGPTDKAVKKAAGAIRDQAKQNVTAAGRVDHSDLLQSIRVLKIESSRDGVMYLVGSDVKHAVYNETGTGIYGPTGARITPKTAKMLAFVPNKNAPPGVRALANKKGVVVLPSVKGMKGIWFMRKAAESAKASDFVA